MNCQMPDCGQPLKVTWWEPVSAQGERVQTVYCINLDCAARYIHVRTERYETEGLAIWIELNQANLERRKLGRMTPRCEAARAAAQAYTRLRNPNWKPCGIAAKRSP
jgi:hypothetical protein